MELQVLCVAAQEGDLQAVAAWLDKGGGVDERCAEHEGATLLFAAAYGGQGAVVRMLLARGASVIRFSALSKMLHLTRCSLRAHTGTRNATDNGIHMDFVS